MGDLQTTQWQRTRAAFLATCGDICSICGDRVDLTLPGTHRDGPHVDHITPRIKGGPIYSRSNLALAHGRCNSAKRDRETNTKHSREW